MAELSTPAPATTTEQPLEAILAPIAIIMAPLAAFTLIVMIISYCAELVNKWIRPYYRHRRAEPLLTGVHELEEFDAPNSNNYHTL